ncbi:MAG: monovalent cation/H(+) antiporter subunit G [Nitrospira sp.]|nr:monovalent cation/H(+) antiporter subunit G [Nitrospira sp.]MCA9478835.1 monovalent cation/H(+) antiporter subunit G [Nitrospira sp.]
MDILAVVLIVIGLFFLTVGAIGMLRLPDVFTRSHAVSLTDSLGAFCLLMGLALYQGVGINMLKILVVLALLFLLNPVIAHATIRAAYRVGVKPKAEENP